MGGAGDEKAKGNGQEDSASTAGAKWASEVDSCIRLFGRLYYTAWGLLAAEVAWVYFLLLAAKLFEGETEGVGHNFLWMNTEGFWPPLDDPKMLLYCAGAALLLLIWLLQGRRLFYAIFFFRPVWVLMLRILRWPLTLVLFLLVVPVLLVFFLLDRLRIRKRERELVKEKIDELKARFTRKSASPEPSGAPTAVPAAQPAGARRDQFDQIKYEQALMKDAGGLLGDRFDALAYAWNGWFYTQIAIGTIGLAPVAAEDFGENITAIKAWSVTMSNSVGEYRRRLQRLRSTRFVRFHVLPPSATCRVEDQARRWRRLLHLDMLLWGAFTNEKPPRLNLHFEHPLNLPDYRQSSSNQAGKPAVLLERELFPLTLELRLSRTVFSAGDQAGPYLAMILAVFAVLRARQARAEVWEEKTRQKGKPANRWDRFALTDPLALAYADERALLEHLAFELLPGMAHAQEDQKEIPSLHRAVADLVSRWTAQRLRSWNLPPDKSDNHGMFAVAQTCVRLLPDDSAAHYRLAAWACLSDNEAAAVAALAKGQQLDRGLLWPSISQVTDAPGIEAFVGERSIGWIPMVLATVARAIAVAGENCRGEITDDLKKTGLALELETGRSLSSRLLREKLGLRK